MRKSFIVVVGACGVRGEVEVQVEHGDVANDLVYYKGHKIDRGNIVENHQSHGRTEVIQRYRVTNWAHRMQRDRPK